MKTYQLNKGELLLPETWDELTTEQKLFAFDGILKITEGKLDPTIFRIQMLGLITGYKPQSGAFIWLFYSLLFIIRSIFIYPYYLIRYGKIRFPFYKVIWKENNQPKRRDRDVINHNLYRLSEKLDFAFSIEDNQIKWKRNFYQNPIPTIQIGNSSYEGRKFVMDFAPFTNITAREYADCFDLYAAYYKVKDKEDRERYLDKMISILYPCTPNYQENMVSNHIEQIRTLSPGMKFGVLFWFSGIVEYYTNHPIYSILFRKEETDEENYYSLGMDEVIFMIEKKGYEIDCNLNDFFNKQIKILKDDLSEAVSKGVEKSELANKTGLNINDINRLVQ